MTAPADPATAADLAAAPSPERLMQVLETTWPPAEIVERDGWRLRRGLGGGKRVSAASRINPSAEIDAAVAAMEAWGQPPLFQITPGQDDLDKALARSGYDIMDRTQIDVVPTAALLDDRSEVARILRGDYRIALAEEVWAEGGIGPERLAVMDRVEAPKTYLMARLGDRPGGVAFAAVDGDVAMIHAIETLAAQRRKGVGRMLMAGAARFACEAGAKWLALAVTEANAPARALYRALGMTAVARYHYRCGKK